MEKLSNLINIPDDLLQIAGLSDAQLTVATTVLSDNITVTTIDAKLRPFKEDKLYEQKLLQTLLPRGCCFVFINNVFVHALYGHPKFGNIDDYLPTDPDRQSDYTKLVFRRKENGECSHWSGFLHEGQIYEMYGSKNVHFVTRTDFFEQDIAKYVKERYQYATKMARNIRSHIKTPEQLREILDYFITTKNTFCAESCFTDSQHLVKYEKTTAFFFAVTNRRYTEFDSHVVISPNEVDELFKSFGLPIVAETMIVNLKDTYGPTEDLLSVCEHFERQENSEGAVVYRMREDGIVTFVYKHKNFDYIFRRALREKMRSKSLSSAIVKRMENLHITHPRYAEMLDRGLRFNAWFRSLEEEKQKHFFENFVSMEEEFEEIERTDTKRISQIYNNHLKMERTLSTVQIIMFVAIPGSSKSTCAKVLVDMLTRQGLREIKATDLQNKIVGKGGKVIHIEQDMFYEKGKGASAAYEKAIETALLSECMDYIILTKSNHSTIVRNNTYRTLENTLAKLKNPKHINLTYVTITAGGDIERTKEICLERIMNRGFAHASLYGKSKKEIDKILTETFLGQYSPLTEIEKTNSVIELEIEDDRLTNVSNLISQLQFFDIIPAFDISDEVLLESFAKISVEDALLAEVSKAKKDKEVRMVAYDAIVYPNLINVISGIKGLIEEIKLNRLVLKTEFHTTLKYHGKKPEHSIDPFEDDVKCSPIITGYAVSPEACAFMVELPTGFTTEKLPHITIALAKSVNASYSATLLEEALSTDTFISLDNPISLNGTTQRICF